MKKTLLSVLAFLFAITVTKAQTGNKISYSIGPEFAVPLNTTSSTSGLVRDYYQDGLGGSAKIEAPITTTLHFTGSAGFVDYPTNTHYLYYLPVSYGSPSEGVQPPPFKFIPIKAGLQYYYDQYLYISGEAGVAFGANSVSTTSVIYSGGLGAVIPFNTKSGLNISARYERGFLSPNYDSPMSQVAIRLAYKFGF
ncbi:MAG: hypothetical protein ACHQHN_10095 [Sphingobacteriales bacterium]